MPTSRTLRHLVLTMFLALLTGITGCEQEENTTPASKTEPVLDEIPPAGPVEAIVHTTSGDFRFLLRPDAAPVACASFINLVQRGFYDGLEFYRHSRVIRQTGNPLNDENQHWECGYRFMPEFSPDLRFDRGGMVALTRLVDDDASPVRPNEFFVTTKPQSERFTFKYPIFGVVVEGQEIINAMPKGARIESIDSWNQSLNRMPDPRRTAP